MTVRDVLQYPHPSLRDVANPITQAEVSSGFLTQLVSDMLETMYATPGTVGLAAPQIGQAWQVFVMDATASSSRERCRVVVNPVMESQSKWKYGREGCLSFPDYLITIKRARKISTRYWDAHFSEQHEEFSDFEAVIFQHEWDHLGGILFIDLAKNLEADLTLRSEYHQQVNKEASSTG